ncbi:MAG: hypothetical protein Q9160_000064 [Pyrenula sp. 1 TL-2023]
MVAPKGTQWLGLGQGSEMAGANIFMMWSSSNPSNITVSPRSGQGNFLPAHNPSARITVLSGSGIDSSTGVLTANIRCDSCLDWSVGTMDPTNPSSSWIWSVHRGDPLNTDNQTQTSLAQHQEMGSFHLNLRDDATGLPAGASAQNPFMTDGTNTPIPLNPSSSSSSSSSSSTPSLPSNATRRAHATLMTLSFILLFPLNALLLYLPSLPPNAILFIHAPLQLLTLALTLAGFGCGVSMARSLHNTSAYHPVIGYVVVAVLVLVQPALGAVCHFRFRRQRGSSSSKESADVGKGSGSGFLTLGFAHQWLGRTMIILGAINGGLGFRLTGPVGSRYVPKYAVIIYSVVAGVVGCAYVAVVVFSLGRKSGRRRELANGKGEGGGKGYSGLREDGGVGMGNGGRKGEGRASGEGGAYAMNTLANAGGRR